MHSLLKTNHTTMQFTNKTIDGHHGLDYLRPKHRKIQRSRDGRETVIWWRSIAEKFTL